MRSALKASQDFDVCRQPCHILIQIKLALFKELWRISTLPQRMQERTQARSKVQAQEMNRAQSMHFHPPRISHSCIYELIELNN